MYNDQPILSTVFPQLCADQSPTPSWCSQVLGSSSALHADFRYWRTKNHRSSFKCRRPLSNREGGREGLSADLNCFAYFYFAIECCRFLAQDGISNHHRFPTNARGWRKLSRQIICSKLNQLVPWPANHLVEGILLSRARSRIAWRLITSATSK
jgi:hypothetical protein